MMTGLILSPRYQISHHQLSFDECCPFPSALLYRQFIHKCSGAVRDAQLANHRTRPGGCTVRWENHRRNVDSPTFPRNAQGPLVDVEAMESTHCIYENVIP